ncbi:MAG TPA: carboxypeptidase-like regulatory domain-containing protein [Terriglobia bacterium]|nr:carboxypeptidase-like regulatory domain-containing protein [Terriglobia bacterium]
MKWLALALTLALMPATLAQQTGGQTEATGVIEGAVVKTTTGQPLKRAVVTAQGSRPVTGGGVESIERSTHTDASGHFILRGLPAGEYNLWANRDGYLGQAYGQDTPNSPGKMLKLASGEDKRDVLFRLIPTGAIVGRVYDEDGEPISGVSVQALRYNYFNGARQLNTMAGSPTNDLGEYRLVGLAPDKYYVSATYTNQDAGDDSSSEAYAPVYYPGTNDSSAAVSVEVQAGAETPIDFNLIPVPAVRVRGQVVASGLNKPGVGVNVMLMRRQSAWSYFQGQTYVNPAQGTFEIRNVPPGSYFLMAQVFEQGKQYYARQPLEVGGADVEGLSLSPGPGAEIRGHLRVEGKAGLKSSDGLNQVDLAGMQINLQPHDQMPFGVQPTQVAADGGFVLKDVPPGNYVLNVCCLPQDLYLKAAHLGSDDALEHGLSLEASAPPGPLDLVIGTAGGHIEGAVTSDQKPAAQAVVVLVPDANHRDQTRLFFSTMTDAQGGFSFGSIPPGDYSLFAWKKIEDGAYYDPDFLSSYENLGKSVRIDEGSKLKVQLELIPPANP